MAGDSIVEEQGLLVAARLFFNASFIAMLLFLFAPRPRFRNTKSETG